MALSTPCQTPGAVYDTRIGKNKVAISVWLPSSLELTEAEASVLEANLHNAFELVLATIWHKVQVDSKD